MNKKIIAAACGLLISSGFVFADDFSFYVGGDLGYNKFGVTSETKDAVAQDNGKFKSKVPTFGLLAGMKFHENVGAEIGYTFYKKAKFNGTQGGNAYDGKVKFKNMHIDLLGYMPVDKTIDLIGAIGFGRMKAKASDEYANVGVGGGSLNKNKTGFRLGAGAQYKFDDHFAARAMICYQKANIKDSDGYKVLKHATSINLGLTYTI